MGVATVPVDVAAFESLDWTVEAALVFVFGSLVMSLLLPEDATVDVAALVVDA